MKLVERAAIGAMNGGLGKKEAGPVVNVGGKADRFEDSRFSVVSNGWLHMPEGFHGRVRGGAPLSSCHESGDGRSLPVNVSRVRAMCPIVSVCILTSRRRNVRAEVLDNGD